jgi:hypothetical protein
MSILKHDDSDDDDYPVPSHLMEPTDPAERRRRIAKANADIDAGRGIPHAEVRAWLTELAAGRPAKAPCDP